LVKQTFRNVLLTGINILGIALSIIASAMSYYSHEKIFNPFVTIKELRKGTALGLSIAYEIVKKNTEGIRMDIGGGKGTTFAISILIGE